MGPNGAGKTTLISVLTGRVRLDQGRLTLFGQAVGAGTHPLRQRLGLVPQEIALFPKLTARENLEMFARVSRVEPADVRQRIDWSLDWTGLASRASEPIEGFSGGMKRRLNIACGVLHQPDLLLLDEPTVGVDPQSRNHIWEMLGQLHDLGTTILLTTHQLDEAERVCQQIAILDHGQIVAQGTCSQLVESTVGSQRRVTLHFQSASNDDLEPLGLVRGTDDAWWTTISDVVDDLPRLLSEIQSLGIEVTDFRVDTPSLQDVFLHLTGRELRE
jgi:ABC-2 type transport system ATP-binding protein